MLELSPSAWTAAVVGAILIGIAKTGLPGVGILAVPIFANILPAKLSTGVVLPMLIAADIFAVVYYRRHAEWPHLWRVFPWTFLGVIIGYLLMNRMDDTHLRPIIGAIVLAMLALNAWRNRRNPANVPSGSRDAARRGSAFAFAALIGIMAGVTTMLANAAGPVMAIYLLAMRLPKTAYVGTSAWCFFVINLVKVPFSLDLGLISPGTLHFNLVLLPAIAAGALLGFRLVRWIPERAFNLSVQVFAILGALKLMWPD